MTDSTNVAKCLFCKNEFPHKNSNQKFCNSKCQTEHQKKRDKDKKERIKRSLVKYKWSVSLRSRLDKFYELFGFGFNCDLCGISFEDALDEYKIPLFCELKPDIRDHKVLEGDSWTHYCFKCRVDILSLRE